MKNCPLCVAEIPDEAAICPNCRERIVGTQCPDCLTLCPEGARKCRWCNFAFKPKSPTFSIKPFKISAQFLPTLLIRGRFLCQTLRIEPDKLIISTPGLFGLSRHEEELPWNKVAGFDYRSGIVWDLVRVETRGQKSSEVSCLSKSDGKKIREVLRKIKE